MFDAHPECLSEIVRLRMMIPRSHNVLRARETVRGESLVSLEMLLMLGHAIPTCSLNRSQITQRTKASDDVKPGMVLAQFTALFDMEAHCRVQMWLGAQIVIDIEYVFVP